jgi:hypothetical protein
VADATPSSVVEAPPIGGMGLQPQSTAGRKSSRK